uniref:protein-histidine N-methyltransferase n=1 Tax=Panagrellus redivivus TaxID=6233 RepID=A0A7E4VEU2_PANRE
MKEETIKEVSELFTKVLVVQPSDNPKELFADHVKIREVLAKVSAEQTPFVPNKDRASKIPAFLDWAKKANIKFDNVTVQKSDKGYSLVAKNPLKTDSIAVEVPRSAILTTDSSKINKGLRELFFKDQLVLSIENCPLVLLLAHEMLDSGSHWQPYLDILPGDVVSVLSMSNDELLALKPSLAFVLALQFFRCIARHYVYFLLMTVNSSLTSKLLPKQGTDAIRKTLFTSQNFTFELYAWCMAIVTSRVNRVPNLVQVGPKTTTSPALIPMMDFANFEFVADINAAQSEVFYAIPQKKVQFLVHRDVEANTELVLQIGSKTNRDCLIYSGFVPVESNPMDVYELRLGFPKGTPQWKIICAQRMGVLSPNEYGATFIIHLATFYAHQLEYAAFWNFAKLFVATSMAEFNTEANVITAKDYLLKRFELYLAGYRDLAASEPKNGTLAARYAWRLKKSEKDILEEMVKYFSQSNETIITSNGSIQPPPLATAEDTSEEAITDGVEQLQVGA